MIELRTQKELRAVRGLQFCCICGKPFTKGEKRTRQHVPPKAIFAERDRTPPLILPAHEECNGDQSPLDTVIGQLVALLHGHYPQQRDLKLQVDAFDSGNGKMSAGVKHLPITTIIFRWARCFHAALYGEYLQDQGGCVLPPFPAGDVVNGAIVYEQMHISRPMMTHLFKQQIKADRTDAILCYNAKCHYRCTWLNFDDGSPFCLFALRLYNWEELGDARYSKRMGCLGWYNAEIPSTAARGTRVEIAVSNLEPLDPFGP